MDVKDVNQAAAAVLFNKVATNSSAEALGAGFASLLGQTASAMDLMAPVSAETRPSAAETTTLADRRDIRSRREDRKPAERPDNKELVRPEKKRAEKAGKSASKSEDNAVVPAVAGQTAEAPAPLKNNGGETPAVQSASSLEAADGAAAAEAASFSALEPTAAPSAAKTTSGSGLQLQPVTEGQMLTKELKVTLLGNSAPMVAAVVDNGMFTVMPEALDMNALAQMGEVSLLDAATGEVKTMSGAELVEKLQAASAQGQLYTYGNTEGKFVNLIPAEIVDEVVSRYKNAASADTSAVAPAAYDDENLAAQAAVLDDKIGLGKKVKVEVAVKGENFTYRNSSDLVQDPLAVEKAVKGLSAEGESLKPAVSGQPETSAMASTTANSASTPAMALNQTAPAAAFNPLSAAAASEEGAAKSVTGLASVTEAGNSALGHAAAGTAEAAAGLRSDAKSNQTSFRDIYKGMAKEVVDQVKVNITKSAVKGVDKIDIRLKPEDLGHIEIKMQISKDGKLSAHIISSRPETMEILQKEMQSLQKAFNDAGLQTDDGALSFSFREGGQTGSEGQDNSGLRSFIGTVFENETPDEFAGNDNLQNWNPAQGLNIRV